MEESILQDTKSPKKLRQKLKLPGQLQSQVMSSRNLLLPKVNLFPNWRLQNETAAASASVFLLGMSPHSLFRSSLSSDKTSTQLDISSPQEEPPTDRLWFSPKQMKLEPQKHQHQLESCIQPPSNQRKRMRMQISNLLFRLAKNPRDQARPLQPRWAVWLRGQQSKLRQNFGRLCRLIYQRAQQARQLPKKVQRCHKSRPIL